LKRYLAWALLVASVIGDVLSWMEIVGKGEPKLVLHLSWFALIFSSLDAVLIEEKDS